MILFQGRKPLHVYFGWKERQGNGKYKQVRLQDGGGLRRHVYDEAMTLDTLKTLFLTTFGLNEKDYKTTKVGNFKGEEIVDGPEPFILHEYLKKHGLFASRVRFYLLTEKMDFDDVKAESKHGDNTDDEDEEKEIEDEEEVVNTLQKLHVAGQIQHSLDVRFVSIVISMYSGLPSSLIVTGWNNAYDTRSIECLDETKEDYNPLKDKYFVSDISVDNKNYLTREWDPPTEDTFFSYPAQETNKPVPAILHGPEVINGYNENHLLIGVIVNFHNELGVMYSWFKDNQKICNGHNLCLIEVSEAGTYFAQVQYGDELLSTEQVIIVMQDIPGSEPRKHESQPAIVGETSQRVSQPMAPKHDVDPDDEIQWYVQLKVSIKND